MRFREERQDGRFRPHRLHPWLDPAVTGDPGHVPARRAVAVDGKERKLAKAGGQKKVHLLAAVTHVPGLVIAQDKVAKSGKASEITHFKPLLAPLPLDDALITSDSQAIAGVVGPAARPLRGRSMIKKVTAAAACGAGGHPDQVAADGGAASPGVSSPGRPMYSQSALRRAGRHRRACAPMTVTRLRPSSMRSSPTPA